MSNGYALPIFDPAGRAVQKTVNSVKVIQTESMHDTAIITLRGESTSAPELQPGTPVQMQYGWQRVDTDFFYGYVDHVEAHYDRYITTASTLQDVVCMGASYSLKHPLIGTWSSMQASTLVSQIADQYYLSSVVENDDTTWSQLAAPGDSAWSFLTQLATKTGYSLACNKTEIRFTSMDLAIKRYWATMPVFQSRTATPDYTQQTLTEFQSLTGEALQLQNGNKATRSISGLDLRSGQIVGAVKTASRTSPLGQYVNHPFFAQQISTAVVNSQSSANNVLAGMTEDNRLPYQATATVSGLTSVRQGVPIVISGIDTNNDGIWWVHEAVHKIRKATYSIDLSLGRDALGDNGLRPSQGSSVAYTPSNPFSYVIANAPPTTLVNNRWRAAHSSSVGVS